MWYRRAQQLDFEYSKDYPEAIEQTEEEQMYDWLDEVDSVAQNGMDEFLSDPHKKQNWQLIPIARLTKIWNDFAKTGIIRDEQGLNEISDIMIKNTLLLHFNTTLGGHAPMGAMEEYLERFAPEGTEWDGELDQLHANHIEDQNGDWRISDYALEPLMNFASQLRFALKSEEKLYIIDKMLNIIHQRSDIAWFFVEGGSQSLQILSELSGNE